MSSQYQTQGKRVQAIVATKTCQDADSKLTEFLMVEENVNLITKLLPFVSRVWFATILNACIHTQTWEQGAKRLF